MKIRVLLLLLLTQASFAQTSIRFAVAHFHPPFIMQNANQKPLGFDVSFAQLLCAELKKTCQFKSYRFGTILNRVEEGEVDAAISAITITLARSARVNFSMPYMLSRARFLTSSNSSITNIKKQSLKGTSIGVSKGSVYRRILEQMDLDNININEYASTNAMLQDLTNDKIDLALFEQPSAEYWSFNSSGRLRVVGPSIAVGYGLGIAINKDNLSLLEEINQAIIRIQDSGKFYTLYNKYFKL